MRNIALVQIEPTTLCNLTCGFCCGRFMKQGKIRLKDFRQALDQFPKVTDLELQGEGEPLIHPDFFEMVKIARERGINVSLISNGSLFTKKNVDKILDLGITRIDCSIDSADPSIFKNIRGFDIEVLIEGLGLLITERNRRGLSFPVVGVNAIVMKQNIHSILDILKLYRKLQLDGGIGFQPLQSMENYTSYYTDFMKEQLISAEDFEIFTSELLKDPLYEEIQRNSKEIGFHASLFRDVRSQDNKFSKCHWLNKAVFINFQGDILPCSQIKSSNEYVREFT